jgi:hypothetical protein
LERFQSAWDITNHSDVSRNSGIPEAIVTIVETLNQALGGFWGPLFYETFHKVVLQFVG